MAKPARREVPPPIMAGTPEVVTSENEDRDDDDDDETTPKKVTATEGPKKTEQDRRAEMQKLREEHIAVQRAKRERMKVVKKVVQEFNTVAFLPLQDDKDATANREKVKAALRALEEAYDFGE